MNEQRKDWDERIGLPDGINLDKDKYDFDERTEEQKLADKQFEENAWAEMAAYEKEVCNHNTKILESIGCSDSDFERLLDGSRITDKIEIVEKAIGENQNQKIGIFKKVYVDQWMTGTEGDSWSGDIYAKISNKKWLKIRFDC